MTKGDIHAKVSVDIEKFGWHCLSVAPRAGTEGSTFSYTVGLTKTFGHPEIILFGLGSKGHSLLSGCVELIKKGTTFEPERPYTNVFGSGFKAIFKRVRPECLKDHFLAALHYYGDRTFEGLVLFWPNEEYLFPWEHDAATSQQEGLNVV